MTPRKRLGTVGKRGSLVRLMEFTLPGLKREKRYIVQWGAKGARGQQSFTIKAEAEAFFKAFEAEASKPDDAPVKLTNRQLWAEYQTAEWEHLRPNTRRLYADAWKTWEQFARLDSIAEDTTIQQIAEFRRALDARGLETATVKGCIRAVRVVFNWGERMERIGRNRWHLFVYKVSKEKRTKPRAEYTSPEFLRIWAALDPAKPGQWRAWVAVGLLGIYGNRQNEILNLQWPWIAGDAVRIDPSVVKTGEEGTLTLFPLTRGILDVARRWAAKDGYHGTFVLYPGKGGHATQQEHYSIQSLTDAIHRAEERAGVETIKWRAGHGFRRGLVGDLIDATGDPTLALQAIGDRDIGMLRHYHAKRQPKIDAAIQGRAGKLVGATQVQSDEKDAPNSPTNQTLTTDPATT
jgi:integrase